MAATAVLFLANVCSAGEKKQWPEKYALVYLPISLAQGTVRLPEITLKKDAKREFYDIIVGVDKPPSIPFRKENCMLGTVDDFQIAACDKGEPLVRAEWVVWDAEHAPSDPNAAMPPLPTPRQLNERFANVVARGTDPRNSAGSWSSKNIYRQLGSFPLEPGKKYIVDVRFMRDGSPLNVANPKLIVIKHGDFW